MPRLFTAIEVPEEICEELHRLRMPLPGARWIKPESYHITLRFAGDIGKDLADVFGNLATRATSFACRAFDGRIHERRDRRDGRLLVNRGAGRVVALIDAQRTTLFLRSCRIGQADNEGKR